MSVEEKKRRIRAGLTKENRNHLYAVGPYLPSTTAERIGLEFPCPIYAQDPLVASQDEAFAPKEAHLRWEPGLSDGPTSARLAVVDYDSSSDILVPPVRWDQDEFRFLRPDGRPVEADNRMDNFWFRQVNAWATVQTVLEYLESPRALGRPIPWGFAGNRLILVPHAGYQENAYYQRSSKALQLYYYGDPEAPSYTSLSHDILAHEAGHAVLDGVRPLYLEHSSRDTAAFHESIADLAALLSAFRHNHAEAHDSEAKVIDPDGLAPWTSSIAEEFGEKTRDRPFLRSARNTLQLPDLKPHDGHHHASQLLTGAMFDVLARLAAQYLSPERQAARRKPATVRQALWWAADRMGSMAFQPLDLLPPADVRYLDYARAVVRNLEITDPADPFGYQELVRRVFHERGFCNRPYEVCDVATCPLNPPSPPRPKVFHDIDRLARSPSDAYLFLHDNREDFEIPARQDFEVIDLYEAQKYRRAVGRLPRQVVVEYLWREKVQLAGSGFGKLAGHNTTLPCGGTIAFDENGNLLSWFHRPGRGSDAGERRRLELLHRLAFLVERDEVALLDEPAGAALSVRSGPVLARPVEGYLRFETAPHLCNRYAEEEDEEWTKSF